MVGETNPKVFPVKLAPGESCFIVNTEMFDVSNTVADILVLPGFTELLFETLPENGFELVWKWLEHWHKNRNDRPWMKEMPMLPTNKKKEYPERPLLRPLKAVLVEFDKDFVYGTLMPNEEKCSANLLDVLHVTNFLNIKPLHSICCAALCELFKKCTDREKTMKAFDGFLDEPLTDETWKKTVEQFPWLEKNKKKEGDSASSSTTASSSTDSAAASTS